MPAGGTLPDTGQQVGDLITRAQAAVAGARWLEALDLAAQALAADPHQPEAAILVGTARQRLGSVGAATAELRQVTVLAIDMERSTTIAARLGPELMRELMLALYEICAEAVARYEGRVTKYSGDGVLAQFGHPIAHEDDARRAVLAAAAMLEAVRLRAPRWESRFGEGVEVRIGIDSGVVAVGPVDASPWSPEELAGDAPNIANRVQSTAEPMTIRVTDATHRLIEGWFETTPVGEVRLRNYPRPVGLHRVVRETEAETRLEAQVRGRPSLVDRDRELAVLRATWNGVVAGGGRQVVVISGEPGIGKSRLVEHMVATAVATGASQLTLACSQLHHESPLRPIARALSRFFRVFPHQGGGDDAVWLQEIQARLEQLPNLGSSVERAVPIFGWLLGIRGAVDLEPGELRRQAFEAVIELLEAMARDSILVLSVEDADAADPSTAELLSALLRRPAVPMLVMLTSRAQVRWIDAPDHLLELGPLGPGDAAELVRSAAPSLDDAVVAQLARRSDGLPFFAEELARAAGEADGSALAETVELSGFLSARLDELGAELKQLVGYIAVAGPEIRLDVLQQLAGLPHDGLERLVPALLDRRVVVRTGGPTSDVLRFRHGLMRSVAYGNLLGTRRAALHERVARILTDLPVGAAEPEDLANHYELGGDLRSAAPRWLDAGQLAAAAGANAEATELFKRCLAALATLPPGPERSRLELDAQLGLGTVLSALEGYTSPDARGPFERAVTLAEGLADAIAIMPALWGAWAYWFVLGEHGVAAALAERCVRIAADEPHQVGLRMLATAINGYQLLYLGDFPRASEEFEWTARFSDIEPPEVFPHDPVIVGVASRAVTLWFLGDREASRLLADEARERSLAQDPSGRRTALTQSFAGCLLAWRAELDGDPETAIAIADQAAVTARDHGYPTWGAAAAMHRAIALCSQGRYDEGLPTLTAVLGAWRAAGQDSSGRQLHPVLMTPYFAGRLAEAQLAIGAAEQAASELERVLRDTAANGEHFWDVELLRLRAAAARCLNAPEDEVSGCLDAARGLAERQQASGLLARLAADEELPA